MMNSFMDLSKENSCFCYKSKFWPIELAFNATYGQILSPLQMHRNNCS